MKTMKSFVLTAAVLVIPVTAVAQTVPVPPVPPVPPAAVVLPAPMPAIVGWPDDLAREAAIRAEEVWERIDMSGIQVLAAEEARVVSEQAIAESRRAMDEARVRMENMRWEVADAQTVWSTSGNSSYESGLSSMSRRDYERAISRFDQVINSKSTRVDGAMYHKAYALYRLGRGSEATATLAQLRKDHPQSRYLKDAGALETAIRQSGGEAPSPESADNDELKLLAINALVHTDPERALPLLEGVINGGANSLQLKTRAIFVLSQSSQPRAKEILMSLAKGAGNPDLQRSAIQYLASRGRERVTSAELKEIYDSTSDNDIKRAVISAWGTMGDMGQLTAVLSGNADMALRTVALGRINDPAAANTLWSIYQREENKDLRMSILSRLGSMGASDRLMDVVRSEKDADVRRSAIRSLGRMKADKSGSVLADLYDRESDVDNKKAIISALSSPQNGEALVGLARKEQNMSLKRDMVQRLSNMRNNKAAMDYMLEIIK